ncbi:BMP family ABC transporter substrate-binding protein [Roseovarius sp. PS-C2]|uniref:BMP family ABC transporter substrate-binding protein n=1 Tax=Roseovarius sp. PS-C2 TaxID=2820814 RepID=UPI001C0BB1C1|nr:BMP family ABC transporter substrate-binding protein [Roseovarius sp. PS-C2]MBU3259153.1 BMP family ABC transporter substrate-binding protein [Roseovarius sp. PS-C2]
MTLKSILTGAVMAIGLGATAAAAQDDKTKVGFIYVGPIGDGGWTYEHDQGRLAIEEHFGGQVETVYQESVPEGADATRAITQMALNGADLIFTTSFGFMEPTINVAKKFPNVKFEHATGFKTAPNVSTYSARFYEGRAIQGHIAGKMTESNIVGYIASYPIPEVIRGINSAFIHARKANPDVQFKIIWAYTWFDPAKEADAATALIEQGADVILQHTDSTAPQAAAEKAGNVISFGQASDMAEYKPRPRVSSIIDNWKPYYIARTQAVIDGTWDSQQTWDGIGPGMVGIGEITDAVPADVREEALALKAAIAAGEYHPFTGPLKKQDGSDWLAEGETADDGTLLGMNFYVEGLDAEIPQ